jgi:hypothetical protein
MYNAVMRSWVARHYAQGAKIVFNIANKLSDTRIKDIIFDLFINRGFLLIFDLLPEQEASDSHVSLSDSGNIRFQLKFDAITCLLYLEHDGSVT